MLPVLCIGTGVTTLNLAKNQGVIHRYPEVNTVFPWSINSMTEKSKSSEISEFMVLERFKRIGSGREAM